MENLCLNPTRNTNVYAHTPVPNFSEQGLRFQRGYSHGYNILTGEAYSPELKQEKSNQNVNNNNHNNMSDNKAKEQMKNNYVRKRGIYFLYRKNQIHNLNIIMNL